MKKGISTAVLLSALLLLTLAAVLAGAGYMLYMSRSDSGQRATARRNAMAATEGMFALAQNTDDPLVQEERQKLIDQWSGVPAQAYRMAGQDYLDVGDVQMPAHQRRD